jgi:hypothetical protein
MEHIPETLTFQKFFWKVANFTSPLNCLLGSSAPTGRSFLQCTSTVSYTKYVCADTSFAGGDADGGCSERQEEKVPRVPVDVRLVINLAIDRTWTRRTDDKCTKGGMIPERGKFAAIQSRVTLRGQP